MNNVKCFLIFDALVDGSREGEVKTRCTESQAQKLPEILKKIAIKLKNSQFDEAVSIIEKLRKENLNE